MSSLQMRSLICVALALATSCVAGSQTTGTPQSQAAAQDGAFATLMPADSYNALLTLTYLPQFTEQVGTGYMLSLTVENMRSDELVFPVDFGGRVQVYDFEAGEWFPLVNGMPYVGRKDQVLAPHGVADPATNSIWQNSLTVLPDIGNRAPPVTIRVSVLGMVYKNGKPTGESAGAYTDITLPP